MRFELTGVERWADELEAALDQEAAEGMNRVDALVADEAASNHPYTSRTGDLEGRTVPGVVRGRLSDGTLAGEVLGDTPYGEYLEEPGHPTAGRFAFLKPAYERRDADVSRAMDEALARAGERVSGR